MAFFIIRIWKNAPAVSRETEWKNEYVYSLPADLYSDAMQRLVQSLVEKEQRIHLKYVHFVRATAGIYGDNVSGTGTGNERLFPLDFTNTVYGRDVTEPLNMRLVLQCVRQAETGRNGKLWYFHSLTPNDVFRGENGRWLIKPSSGVEALVNGLWPSGFDAWHGGQFVAPQRSGNKETAISFYNSILICGHALEARAYTRTLAKLKPKGQTLLTSLGYIASQLHETTKELKFWLDLETEFGNFDLKRRALEALEGVKEIGKQITEWLDGTAQQNDPEAKPPLPRYGAGVSEVIAQCSQLKAKSDIAIESISKITGYTFVDGTRYLHLNEVSDMYDILRPLRDATNELIVWDWNTPLQQAGTTSET
jgi:hypothetical protein